MRTRVLSTSSFGAKFSHAYRAWLNNDKPEQVEGELNWEQIGVAFKQIREYGLNLSNKEMADRYDISSSYVSRIEHKTLDQLPWKLIKGLFLDGYSVDDLLAEGMVRRQTNTPIEINAQLTESELGLKLLHMILQLDMRTMQLILNMVRSHIQVQGSIQPDAANNPNVIAFLEEFVSSEA